MRAVLDQLQCRLPIFRRLGQCEVDSPSLDRKWLEAEAQLEKSGVTAPEGQVLPNWQTLTTVCPRLREAFGYSLSTSRPQRRLTVEKLRLGLSWSYPRLASCSCSW